MDGTHSLDQFGQLDFAFGGRAEAGADLQHLAQSVCHDWRAVAQDQRAPGQDVVDVLVAVDVEDLRSFAASDERRRAAHAAKRSHGRIDAARNQLLRASKEGFGSAAVHTGALRFFRQSAF